MVAIAPHLPDGCPDYLYESSDQVRLAAKLLGHSQRHSRAERFGLVSHDSCTVIADCFESSRKFIARPLVREV